MGISYSTAKWLVGPTAILTFLSYADLFQRRQQVSSLISQRSSMAYSPLPTCSMSIMQTYLSGALCRSSLVASSSPNSCSSSRGSTACTSLIQRSRSSGPSWTKSVCFCQVSLSNLGIRLTQDRSGLRTLLFPRQCLHRQYVLRPSLLLKIG